MEKPLEDAPIIRHYASEKLQDAQLAILKGNDVLPLLRSRVEKYRQGDVSKAKDAYAELSKARARLVDAFGSARLALLEMEEYALADIATQLANRLAVFNLMQANYRKVYDGLKAYADRLPVGQTTNASVIGRLMNNVKMGYYPTDLANIEHILRGTAFPAEMITNVFDPCCGCGKALRKLAQGNNCYAYGVELDESRATEAQTRLHRVAFGSFFHSRISHEAFHVMLLNPPYLSVLNESGNKSRHEKRFLVDGLWHLMIGGLLIYIIPYYRLTPDICRILSDNFEDLSVWRFTEDEFQKFKQVAVLGLRRKRIDGSAGVSSLAKYAFNPELLPCITEMEAGRYPLPAVPKTVEVFRGERFNEKELEQQLTRSDSFTRLMAHSELDKAGKRPLLPLSIGQVGLIGGSGLINGLVDCDTPHIIKGRIVKEKRVSSEEQYSTRGMHMGSEVKETITNKMIFNILTKDGFKSLM